MGYNADPADRYGTLSDITFDYGGTTNTFYQFHSSASIFSVQLGTGSDFTAITSWTLHVGSEKFTSASGIASGTLGYFWNPPMLPSWSDGDTVTVKLVETKVPSAPRNLHAKGTSTTQIDLSWNVPEYNGGSDDMGYTIEVSTDRGIMWTEVVASQTATTYSHTVTPGVSYYYRVSATNVAGTGVWSRTASATAEDTAPGVVSAEIRQQEDSVVTLFFDEAPVSTSTPAASAFTVKVGGKARTPLTATIFTKPGRVRLVLADAIKPGERVTVSYTKPSLNPLKDAAANETASFTDYRVGNELPTDFPELLVHDEEVHESGDGTTRDMTFTVSVDTEPDFPVGVHYETENGSATGGATCSGVSPPDYISTSGRLTFGPGETSKEVVVTVCDDGVVDSGETFRLVLRSTQLHEPISALGKIGRNGKGYGDEITASETGTILNEETSAPRTARCSRTRRGRWCAVRSRSALRMRASTKLRTRCWAFEVTLNRAAPVTVTVDYATADGTATAGADYTAMSGTLTFTPGETQETVNVTVLDDVHDDTEETLTLALTNAVGARVRDAEATGTIVNSDPIPQAWLGRFGRTVAGHVVDAVSGRLEGSADGGSHVTLGGRRLALDGAGGAGPEGAARRGAGDGEAARQEAPSWERGHLARMDTGGPAATRVHSRACGPGGQDARAPRDASRKTWLECNDAGASRSPGDDWMHARDAHGTRTMTGRELLLGSAFHLTHGGEADGAGGGASTRWTAWGRAAASGFDGEADGLSVDGDVTTFTLGADAARGRWLGGVALAHSTGTGGFRDPADTASPDSGTLESTGELESTLTSVHPYLRFRASERLSLWGVLGYGTGELTLETDGNGTGGSQNTDTSMWMTAAGARGVLLSAADHDGFELAARGDGQFVRMSSDAVSGSNGLGNLAGNLAGNLDASEAQTSRVRFLLEGSQRIALAGGQALRPTLEVGLRHDGGDAETGTGIELGAGVSYADPALGLTVEGKARGLLAHEDTDYREWGASGSVRIASDAAGRGLSLTLTPAWGADSGGAEGLWSARDARALAANDAFEPAGRLDAEVGYGLGAFGGRGLMRPFAGLSLSDAGTRIWRSGVRWRLEPDLSFGVEGARRGAANDDAAEHEIGFRLTARW